MKAFSGYERPQPEAEGGDLTMEGWVARPKESPRDQNLKQAPNSYTAELLAALDRAYDRIAVEAPGNDAESIKTLRRFFGEL
jgi:hypothetical protein